MKFPDYNRNFRIFLAINKDEFYMEGIIFFMDNNTEPMFVTDEWIRNNSEEADKYLFWELKEKEELEIK